MNKEKQNSALTDEFGDQIVAPTYDLTKDIAELTFDKIAEEGILRDLPIVKILVGTVKTVVAVREYFTAKKLLIFLQRYHNNEIDPVKLEAFKKEFSSDKKYREKTTENLIVFLDRFNTVDKAKIYANLFTSYINGKFSWDIFLDLSHAVERVSPSCFGFLEILSNNNYVREDTDEESITKYRSEENILSACGLGQWYSYYAGTFEVNQLGKILYEEGLSKNKR